MGTELEQQHKLKRPLLFQQTQFSVVVAFIEI